MSLPTVESREVRHVILNPSSWRMRETRIWTSKITSRTVSSTYVLSGLNFIARWSVGRMHYWKRSWYSQTGSWANACSVRNLDAENSLFSQTMVSWLRSIACRLKSASRLPLVVTALINFLSGGSSVCGMHSFVSSGMGEVSACGK